VPPDADDYVSVTRDHYRDPDVAKAYEARLRSAPADRLLTRLEISAVDKALRRLRAGRWNVVLDVPAGTGKLRPLLTGRADTYIAADISRAMLSFLGGGARVVANAEAFPLRTDSVDVAVCLRLLHRVPRDVFTHVVSELVRSASTGCVISYAGPPASASLYAVVRRVLRRPSYPRHAWTPEEVAQLAQGLGATVVLDRSVSFGLTSERVAALAFRS
jgi:SAM-dependent methyltransferase